ncbi:MAG TPA: hypothetical protein VNV86_03555 [Candidatus Acidoferrum sp.]|nr:hypothetical protein [Candidatus Acidoferrum sp.]
MKRFLSLYSLIPIMIAAGAANLHAQNVAVDKSSLTFSAQFGGPAVSQSLTVTSSTGAAITFFTFSNAAWVKVNNQTSSSGTTPSTVTVSADPTGLNPGTYNTSISVFGGANSVSVGVTLTVSTIGVNPSSVTFSNYTVGSITLPAPQSITLSGTATTFTAAATTTTGGAWLQVTPTTGNSPGAITAVLNTALVPGLAVGTYQGKITITPTGSGTTNIPIDIPVTFTVSSAPVVTATPTPLQFNIQIAGANNISSQPLTVAVAPAAQLGFGFTASVDANPAGKNWITINPPNGNTNQQTGQAQVTVGVDTTNLPANTYNGKITLITPGGTPAQQDIPVKLTVSASPLLNVPPTPLVFTYQLGGNVPATQNVNVTATSSTLNYTLGAGATATWLTVPTSGTTAAPFPVSVNPTGLTPGSYTTTITVTGTTAGSGSAQIPVTLNVTNDAMIVTNYSAMSFPFQIGQAAPAGQVLKITSSTGSPLSFTATAVQTNCTGSNWLVLAGNAGVPATGSTDASLVVSVNPAGLPAGTCTGKITVAATVTATGAAAVNSPFDIPVALYVSAAPLLVVNPTLPPVFNVALGANSVPPQNITLTSTSPAAADQLNYTATFQTNNGGNWLFVGPLAGTTASGNVLTISVIPSLLSAGTYTGTVTITATGAGAVANSPVTIPVVLNITAGSIVLSGNSLSFTSTLGGANPQPQTVTIGSSAAALTYSAVASTGVNPTWLSVTPTSGNTSKDTTLTATVDSSKLTPGTYTGRITVTAPGAGNSPAVISVSLVVQPGTISAPTTALTFSQVAGGTAPAAQTIAVSGSPSSLNFAVTTSPSTPWLTATPASGSTPGNVQVSVSAGTMPVGQYNGSVTITSSGAAGSPITVPVVLNVVASQTLTANPTSLTFAYTIGQTAPAAQTLLVGTSGASAPFSVQVPATAPWLAVTPTSGTAPGNISVSVTPGTLTAGSYTASITVTSSSALTPLTIPVTFNVVQIPKPVVSAIGNAASYSTGSISPGENIVIFGTGVGPAAITTGTVTNGVWSNTVGNTRVLFDGVPAPVIYASSTQTSVMVPYGVNGRPTTSVVVEFTGVQSTPLTYNVVAASPGIYTLNQQGTGPGAVINQDGVTVNSPNTPAAHGSFVSVYMTGEGQTAPPGVDGAVIPPVLSSLKNPVLPVTATVGGVQATVVYAGSAAGLISGVMQVNLIIPAGAPTGGAVPIVVTVGTAPSQSGVTIAVNQ